jgi:hypothetical protein
VPKTIIARALAVAAVPVAVAAVGAGFAFAATPALAAAPAFAATPLAASVSSATPVSLSSVQAKAAAAITARVNALNAASSGLERDRYLGADQATLSQRLQAAVPGLQALGQKIAADTTVSTAEADTNTIYSDYRVYVLLLPSTRLAVASDDILNGTVPRLTAISTSLSPRVSASGDADAATQLADLTSQISGASSAVSGLAATLASDTPAQWNANHGILDGATTSIATARSDVKKAATDISEIRGELRHPSSTAA